MTRDWILVRGSTPEAIRAATIEHSGIAAHEVPTTHRAAVYQVDGDQYAIVFDPPLPPYAFTNLINWLDDPKMTRGATGAMGWLTSPGEGARYWLAPKRPDKRGDTLVGVDEGGERVEVFLPDCSLTPARHAVTPTPEPLIALSELQPVAEFEVTADSDREFGNPSFAVG